MTPRTKRSIDRNEQCLRVAGMDVRNPVRQIQGVHRVIQRSVDMKTRLQYSESSYPISGPKESPVIRSLPMQRNTSSRDIASVLLNAVRKQRRQLFAGAAASLIDVVNFGVFFRNMTGTCLSEESSTV